MGKENQSIKDRKCNICGEWRQRNASTLKRHAERCIEALKVHVKGGGDLDSFLGSVQYATLRAYEILSSRS